MRKITFILFIVTTLLIGVGTDGVAQAQDHSKRDPLIDILIRKGILTEHDAEGIDKEARTLEKQRQQLPKALKGLKVGILAYIDYSAGQEPEPDDRESSFNEFRLTRGHLTVKKELLPWMHTRITIDIHRDDTGDYKL